MLLLAGCGEQTVSALGESTEGVVDGAVSQGGPENPANPVPAEVAIAPEYLAHWVLEVPTSTGRTVYTLGLVSNQNGDFFAVEKRCKYAQSENSFQLLAPRVFVPIHAFSENQFYSLAGTETLQKSLTDAGGNLRHCEAAIRGGEYTVYLDDNDKLWIEQPDGNVSGLPKGPYTRNP